MNRRDFLCSAAAMAMSARSLLAAPLTLDIKIGGPLQLPPIGPGFIGLGYEISSVSRPGLLGAGNEVYARLVQQLSKQGVIRVGGNTADYAHYRVEGAPVSSPYGTLVNDAVLLDLGAFLRETGWQLIWALNLGSGTEAEAIAEAKAVMTAAGDRLLAFEIGNEPDLFSHEKHRAAGYTYEAWLADYRRYKSALRAQLPGIPLAGPDVAGKTDWVTRFAADEGKDAVLLTHHYYREGQNPTSTIEKLLGEDPKLLPQLATLRSASELCGVPYRICEVNSFSGGGRPGVSDTLAGALWALDYLFTLAMHGCAGVNMETGVNQLGFVSSYSPIGDDEHGHYTAKPEYYGMLAFALAGRGTLLEVSTGDSPAAIKAYATSTNGTDLRIAVINKGPDAAHLQIHTGRAGLSSGHILRLTAEKVDATTGVTLGGAQVSAEGIWRPTSREAMRPTDGVLTVPLPGYSAAVVLPDPT